MAIFEVFLKKDGRDEFRHVGALDAANDELALVSARECYVRRAEGDLLWVVRRDNILSPEREFTAPNHIAITAAKPWPPDARHSEK